MRKTGCQLNNKGLTFVEILVAVTMLTLVSLVFLRCISQTAFYNQRAREKQSALNLAQSLMEGFKAYDLGSIDAQFGSSIQSDFKMYNLEDSAAQSMSGTGSYGLSRVKINGVEYDARISMTEYTPAVSSVVAKTGLVESDIPNKYTDAIYCGDEISKEQKGIYQMVVDELKDATKVPDMKAADRTALTVDTLKINKLNFLNASRNTNVVINAGKVEVSVDYDYKFTYEYETETGSTKTYTSTASTYNYLFNATDLVMNCFDNSTTGVTLGNVYLYYYPAYNSNQGGQVKCTSDVINITNNTGEDKKVYVIKQHNRALSSGELAICEGSYTPKVVQSGSAITLYHNLKENLSGSGGSGCYTSGSITNKENYLDNANATKASRTQTTLLYSVNISIYKTGETDPIYVLNGTVNAR